jgi:hypothetical protein
MWFKLTGDERLGRCATEGCGQQPTSRYEGGGVGSNYCSACREDIELAEAAIERQKVVKLDDETLERLAADTVAWATDYDRQFKRRS